MTKNGSVSIYLITAVKPVRRLIPLQTGVRE